MIIGVLVVIVIVLSVSVLIKRKELEQFELINKIAASRRKLIEFTHRDILDVNSELFKFSYTVSEYLLRVRYFKLYFLLPDAKNLLIIRKLSRQEKVKINQIMRDLDDLSSRLHGQEAIGFYEDFFRTLIVALIRNNFFYKCRLLYYILRRVVKIKFRNNSLISAMKSILNDTTRIENEISLKTA